MSREQQPRRATHSGPVRVRPLDTRTGFRILDDIEHAQFEVYTASPVTPTPGSESTFRFPVDIAVRLRTSELTFPKTTGVIIRRPDGETVVQSMDRSPVDLPHGRYDIEVPTAPVKLYLAVESSVSVGYDGTEMRIDVGDETQVEMGIRSFHERPAGTITTPADPESMMQAVSLFGSALSTTSPERSFPTLRGHPPLLEIGESFDVPSEIEPLDSGMQLVLPRDRQAVYASASLAYYLGAEVVPGQSPRLIGNGWERPLGEECSLETDINRTLQHVFFLDCLTRTEGLYPVDLRERRAVENALDGPPDFARLYDLPLAERLRAYLDIPFADLATHRPEWHLTTDVRPTPGNAEMLPFVAHDLSLVRCPDPPTRTSRPEPEAVTNFYRRRGDSNAGTTDEIGLPANTRGGVSDMSQVVHPDPADTVEHAWIGDGYPLGASKAMPSSYHQRIERDVEEKSSISITVVCNDEQMREEDIVAEFYGLRDILQFDIEVKYDQTTAELREILRTPTDFLHYIGHVDEDGIQCTDGALDVRTIDEDAVAIDSFLLNACQSYEQGEALIERGSLGGVVTLTDVANVTATKLGRMLARLLNCGFTLRTALSLAQEDIITGYQYMVIGDGGLVLCQGDSGTPVVATLEPKQAQYDVTIQYYPASNYQPGSMGTPHLMDTDEHCLTPGQMRVQNVPAAELEDFLNLQLVPIRLESGLEWSDEFSENRRQG